MKKKTQQEKDRDTIVGERLRIIRKKNKLLQQDIADLLGVSQNTIGYYESGHTSVDNESLLKLCDRFGVEMNFFTDIEYKPSEIIIDKTQAIMEDKSTIEFYKKLVSDQKDEITMLNQRIDRLISLLEKSTGLGERLDQKEATN